MRIARLATSARLRPPRGERAGRRVEGRARRHVALVDRAVDEPEGDPVRLLVGEEPALARGDDAREPRVALVRDQEALERHARGADVLEIDDRVAEGGV